MLNALFTAQSACCCGWCWRVCTAARCAHTVLQKHTYNLISWSTIAIAVYLLLRLVLTRLHGGALHTHQPLRTSDEEWDSETSSQQRHQPGTIKLDGLPVDGGLPSNSHADRWAPAKSVQLADL